MHGQPIDYMELEQHRLSNMANAMLMAITEGFGEPVDTREWAYDDASFGFGRAGQPVLFTSLNDRDDGKYLPIYQTEYDLRAIRAEARNVMAMSGALAGAVETLSNYTFGKGFKFSVQKSANCPAGIAPEMVANLVVMCQKIIDKFLLDNHFQSNMDRELDCRCREDGESFVELSINPVGKIIAEFDESDQICQPSNPAPIEDWLELNQEWKWSWTFGVHTKKRCPSDALGYHVVYDTSGDDWDYVPCHRMLHVKRNVPRNVKRGVSDLYWVANDVQRELKIRKNTADASALQSAIAWFRQHAKGVTPQAVQGMINGQAVATRQQATTTGTRPTKQGKLRSGTVVDIPEGLEVLPGPMGAERNPNFLLVAQYVSRAIATRWQMPEHMFTSDASNANYASTLAAESPFTKAREADQRFYAEAFIELLWKVLRLAQECGKLASNIKCELLMQMLEIKCDPPRVAVRDELQTVMRLKEEVAMGLTSPRTASGEIGRDYDQQLEEGAKPTLVAGGAPAPGQPGTPVVPVEGGMPTEMSQLSRLQWTRNAKAIKGILSELRSGDINDALALELLTATGLARDRAERLVHGEADPEVDQVMQQTPDSLAEDVDPDMEVTIQKRPARDFPKGVMTYEEIQRDASKRINMLYDDLERVMANGASRSRTAATLRAIEQIQAEAALAAHVSGLLTPFRPNLQDGESAKDANVTPLAAAVTVAEE